jgi:hypothetical protein
VGHVFCFLSRCACGACLLLTVRAAAACRQKKKLGDPAEPAGLSVLGVCVGWFFRLLFVNCDDVSSESNPI